MLERLLRSLARSRHICTAAAVFSCDDVSRESGRCTFACRSAQRPRGSLPTTGTAARCRLSSADRASAFSAAMGSFRGVEFLDERLRRATAVPASDRSPDVAAFVESHQLLAKPALAPSSAADRAQVLAALLRVAGVAYACPDTPMPAHGEADHRRGTASQGMMSWSYTSTPE